MQKFSVMLSSRVNFEYDNPKNKVFHRFKALSAKRRLPDSKLAVSLEER